MGLAAVGGAYQTVGTALDASSSSMPGRLVDVGGHQLHLNCTGTGSPTVVLEAGGGAMAAQLAWITPGAAPDTTICVYDRAGRGWSEAADSPQDALAISTDLHTLLHLAGVPGPYVMAGHSFGGLYALTYAANHPGEVTGLVLIDSTSPDYGNPVGATVRPASSRSDDVVGRAAALTSSVARLGLGRLFAALASSDLPPYERAQVRATSATPATLRSIIEEYGRASASTDEAASLRDFGDKPLVHRVVDGAIHASLVSEQTHAATTSQAILEVVSAVRTRQPLSR
jgi:pimeloyl-ACP methyl ester carboxylesterase